MVADRLYESLAPDDLGCAWWELDTPALLVDLDRLEANLDAMATHAAASGVALRPHVKTHKSAAIAAEQLARGAGGLTVAKLDEAEALWVAGIDASVLVAFQIVAAPKLERAAALAARLPLILAVDGIEGARALDRTAAASGIPFEVWLEIDCGLERCGVRPGDAIPLARAIAELSNLRLTGMFTHAGHAYAAGGQDEIRDIAAAEAASVIDAATAARRAGIPIATVSAGSTPTAKFLGGGDGLTEIRPGTYAFYDALQVALGTVLPEACALTVAATVVSRPAPDRAVIDAGSKTFGLDKGAHSSTLLGDYGRLVGSEGAVVRLSEEHGVLRIPARSPLRVGDRVRVVPNHVCSTTNLGRRYHGLRGDVVESVLPIHAAGGVH